MNKIIPFNNLKKFIKQQTREKIILVGGCFDILHPGHIDFLRKSKDLGGTLMVLLESDRNIERRKGREKPILKQRDRAKVLSELSSVDIVVMLIDFKSDEEYFELVKKIKPDIIAITEGDSLKNIKMKQAKIVKGKVITVMKREKKYSTSSIIGKLKRV